MKKAGQRRDEASTTYVRAIEPAAEFGWRIYGEAERRGLRRASSVIVLGDSAPWIWALAEEHFPGATQIVDLYHTREHLTDLSRILYEAQSSKATLWSNERIAQLDQGNVESLLSSMRLLRPTGKKAKEELRKTINLHHCLALQQTQRSLGGVLGITRRILARATYKFVAHPPPSGISNWR
jgi:hypothetical protein